MAFESIQLFPSAFITERKKHRLLKFPTNTDINGSLVTKCCCFVLLLLLYLFVVADFSIDEILTYEQMIQVQPDADKKRPIVLVGMIIYAFLYYIFDSRALFKTTLFVLISYITSAFDIIQILPLNHFCALF